MAKKQISDEAVIKATGKNWDSWLSLLNRLGGKQKSHKELVALLKENSVSLWWQQAIAGQYEKQIQGRKKHQMPNGFQATASRTINTSVNELFANLNNGNATWFPDGAIDVSTEKPFSTLRGAWTGKEGGRVDIMISEKSTGKCSITINHTKLATETSCDQQKSAWRTALSTLKKRLEQS